MESQMTFPSPAPPHSRCRSPVGKLCVRGEENYHNLPLQDDTKFGWSCAGWWEPGGHRGCAAPGPTVPPPMPPADATHQCHPSVPPISATHRCHPRARSVSCDHRHPAGSWAGSFGVAHPIAPSLLAAHIGGHGRSCSTWAGSSPALINKNLSPKASNGSWCLRENFQPRLFPFSSLQPHYNVDAERNPHPWIFPQLCVPPSPNFLSPFSRHFHENRLFCFFRLHLPPLFPPRACARLCPPQIKNKRGRDGENMISPPNGLFFPPSRPRSRDAL